MIYTLTLNPSIDYVMNVPHFENGAINRSQTESISVGGKGINVSIVLQSLNVPSVALGFVAGQTGSIIENMMTESGVEFDFIRLNNGFSRINVKLKSDTETDVNGAGPAIDSAAVNMLYDKLDMIDDGDFLVLAGSVSGGMTASAYADIMAHIKEKNVKVVVDATGDLLTRSLEYKPFLIKPNNFELAEIFGRELSSSDDIIECARRLQDMGAQNVLVSLGGAGAVLVCDDGTVLHRGAPEGKVINTTGAGDSSVAGFIAGYIATSDYGYALSLGVCAGSATAFSESLATGEQIMNLM